MNSTVATRATEIVLPGKVEPGGLQVRSRDLSAPAAGQVMLRMDATGGSRRRFRLEARHAVTQSRRLRQVSCPDPLSTGS